MADVGYARVSCVGQSLEMSIEADRRNDFPRLVIFGGSSTRPLLGGLAKSGTVTISLSKFLSFYQTDGGKL